MTPFSGLPRRLLGAVIFSLVLAASFVVAGPAWALPSPALLVYADGLHQVFTAGLNGASPTRVLTNADAPVVSPDGTQIAFVQWPSGKLAVSSISGSGIRVLSADSVPTSWTTDGTTVAVQTSRGIGTVNTITGVRRVFPSSSQPGLSQESNPQISPDNTFVSSEIIRSPTDTTGGGLHQVIRRLDGSARIERGSARGGFFSPDGTLMLQRDDFTGTVNFQVRTSISSALRWSGSIPTSVPTGPFDFLKGAAFSPDSTTAFLGVRYFFEAKDIIDHPVAIYTSTLAHPDPTLLIANVDHPSVGGGVRRADANGAPPAVTGATVQAGDNAGLLRWTLPAVPDIAGVEVRFNVGLTYPASVAAGSDWGRVLDSSLTERNLPPDTTYSVSIFSRDWYGNVGPAAHVRLVTPHQSLTSLSSHAVPFDLVYPGRTTISGVATRTFDGAPVAGAALDVSRQVLGTSSPFAHLGTVVTDAHGRWSFVQTPGTSYFYRVTFASTAAQAQATSVTRVRVGHAVSISISATRAPANSFVRVTARTTPALVKGLTYLQSDPSSRPGGGPFGRIGPHATDAQGVVIYTVRVPARGVTWRYRVEVPGATPYIGSFSGPVSITGT